MRVCGVKDTGFAVWLSRGSSRVFFRVGHQRYGATVDEIVEFASQMIAAVDALRDGREFAQSFMPSVSVPQPSAGEGDVL